MRSKGFTLVEMMIVIAILSIVLGIAVPNLKNLVTDHRLSSSADELAADLMQARTEAIRIGGRVTVCPSSNGSSCAVGADASNWVLGWIAFNEVSTATGGCTPALGRVDSCAGEAVIRVAQSLPSSHSITKANGSAAVSNISFSSRGMAATVSGTSMVTSLTDEVLMICSSGRLGRLITLSTAGRAVRSTGASTCS